MEFNFEAFGYGTHKPRLWRRRERASDGSVDDLNWDANWGRIALMENCGLKLKKMLMLIWNL